MNSQDDSTRAAAESLARVSILRSAEQLEAAIKLQKTVIADGINQATVVAEILNERYRQDEKWGPVPRLDHPFGRWLKILIEEIGEACKADLKNQAADGGWEDTQAQVDVELNQAAAVLVAWLEHRSMLRELQHGS